MRGAIMALVCLLVMTGMALAANVAGTDAPPLVPLRVKRVVLINDAPAVLLTDEAEARYLLIFVDLFTAGAIRMGLDGTRMTRPLTHDLIGNLLQRLGARLTRITITELRDATYFALISVQVNGEVLDFDARPSDALALAVRAEVPIFGAPALLKALGARPLAPEAPEPPQDQRADDPAGPDRA